MPPGAPETVVIGQPGMCTSGDVAEVSFSAGGESIFSLVSEDTVCSPAKDNRKEEYTLILYNVSENGISFRVDAPTNTSGLQSTNVGQSALTANHRFESSFAIESTQSANEASQMFPVHQDVQTPFLFNAMSTEPQLGDEVEFRVRSSQDDNNQITTSSAVLLSRGTFIDLYVDRDIPVGQANNVDSPSQTQLDLSLIHISEPTRPY